MFFPEYYILITLLRVLSFCSFLEAWCRVYITVLPWWGKNETNIWAKHKITLQSVRVAWITEFFSLLLKCVFCDINTMLPMTVSIRDVRGIQPATTQKQKVTRSNTNVQTSLSAPPEHSSMHLSTCDVLTQDTFKRFSTHWLSEVTSDFSLPSPVVRSSPWQKKLQLTKADLCLHCIVLTTCVSWHRSYLLISEEYFSLRSFPAAPNTVFWFPPNYSPVKGNGFKRHFNRHSLWQNRTLCPQFSVYTSVKHFLFKIPRLVP